MRVRQQAVSRSRALGFALGLHAVLATITLLALPVGTASSERTTREQSSPPQAKTPVTDELTARRQRAESGDAGAQYDLGVAYAYGNGVAQDYAMSAAWYLKAADQGLARAQHNLAALYLNGQGVTTDKAEALKWLGLEEAGASGAEKAALGAVLKNLAATMTTAEVADAQRRANDWARGSARNLDLGTLSAMTHFASASAVAPRRYRPGDGMVPPRLRKETVPEYSRAAKERGIEGRVVLDCVVQIDGKVSYCQVAQSLDKEFGLDEQAIKAARKWRFEPGTRFGQPVPVIVTIELTFTLR